MFTCRCLDDRFDEKRVLGDPLRHEQDAFWDAESLTQTVVTASLKYRQPTALQYSYV